jgi:hypothetical protein
MLVIGSLCEETCGHVILCGFDLDAFSGDGMRPTGWFVIRRAFAPRRLYCEKELMALLVVVKMSDTPQ